MKPGRTWTSISLYGSPYISFQAFTWDRPKNELRAVYFILSLVHVDYVNYHVVIFMAHLHLNELTLRCDMWLNKLTYLLTRGSQPSDRPSPLPFCESDLLSSDNSHRA